MIATLVKGFREQENYDISLAVWYDGKTYRQRLTFFKRLGFHNLRGRKVHVCLVTNPGDSQFLDELLADWPLAVDVTLIECTSGDSLLMVNNYYLWLATATLKARWNLCVDVDSVTDIDNLLTYVDERFGTYPVHLTDSPIDLGDASVVEDLSDRRNPIATRHEQGASLTSSRALNILAANERALSELRTLGEGFSVPGYLCLATAMYLSGIPVIACPVMAIDFARTRMSLVGGGSYYLPHVNWGDSTFTMMLEAFLDGSKRASTLEECRSAVDRPLVFGRCIGEALGELILNIDGSISGSGHPNEHSWSFLDGGLVILSASGLVKSIFNMVLEHKRRKWLVGPFADEAVLHFLRLQ